MRIVRHLRVCVPHYSDYLIAEPNSRRSFAWGDDPRRSIGFFKPRLSTRSAARQLPGEDTMKGLSMLGAVLLVLGLLAFVVPVPHSENHGVKIGDAKIGVQTEHSERLPPLVAGGLVAAGIVVLVLGLKQG